MSSSQIALLTCLSINTDVIGARRPEGPMRHIAFPVLGCTALLAGALLAGCGLVGTAASTAVGAASEAQEARQAKQTEQHVLQQVQQAQQQAAQQRDAAEQAAQ